MPKNYFLAQENSKSCFFWENSPFTRVLPSLRLLCGGAPPPHIEDSFDSNHIKEDLFDSNHIKEDLFDSNHFKKDLFDSNHFIEFHTIVIILRSSHNYDIYFVLLKITKTH